jgi:hypothetical protein
MTTGAARTAADVTPFAVAPTLVADGRDPPGSWSRARATGPAIRNTVLTEVVDVLLRRRAARVASLVLVVPDVALPDVALPDVALPDVALPDVALPDVALPVTV